MLAFALWIILILISWPLALVALVLYPIVWLLALPFRLMGITVRGVFDAIEAVVFLPGRLLRRRRAR